ncbi:MAG: hypothetical protein HYS22_00445 [Deltaproteobacteria bacterium]|nr:hypothetical protein [Deltaproteobacteria bacterium]
MANPLHEIWQKVEPKVKKGNKDYIQYLEQDLIFLYRSQFADNRKCTLDEWKKGFRDSLQKDGTYLVSYEQFLAKARYYNEKMPTSPPFDPDSIKEGPWKESDLDQLFQRKIKPETLYTDEEWAAIKEKLRKMFPQKEGWLLMNPLFKKELKYILETYPSVMRQRAINIQKEKLSGGKSSFTLGTDPSKGIVQRFRKFLRFGS